MTSRSSAHGLLDNFIMDIKKFVIALCLPPGLPLTVGGRRYRVLKVGVRDRGRCDLLLQGFFGFSVCSLIFPNSYIGRDPTKVMSTCLAHSSRRSLRLFETSGMFTFILFKACNAYLESEQMIHFFLQDSFTARSASSIACSSTMKIEQPSGSLRDMVLHQHFHLSLNHQ